MNEGQQCPKECFAFLYVDCDRCLRITWCVIRHSSVMDHSVLVLVFKHIQLTKLELSCERHEEVINVSCA